MPAPNAAADALFKLGCQAFQAGDSGGAERTLRQAISLQPGRAEYYSALATVLLKSGRVAEAEQSLRHALTLELDHHLHSGLGVILRMQGRLAEAIEQFQDALARGADKVETNLHLGRTHAEAGNQAAGERYFEAVLEMQPGHARALWDLRKSLIGAQRHEQAAAHLQRGIQAQQGNVQRLCHFANALQTAGDLEGAISVCVEAVAVDPESADAWYCFGFAETARAEYVPAITCFQRVLALRPDWLEARHNLARALYEMGDADAAFEHFRMCAARPEKAAALSRAMLAVIVPGIPSADNAEVLATRRAWADRDVPVIAAAPSFKPGGQRLRIGYVSSFFHRDNWMKPVWGLINQHDRAAVEVHLFSDAPRASILHGYQPHTEDRFFHTGPLNNAALRGLTRDYGIQVLVDLNGFSDMQRIPMFASRAAPVSIGWFNSYATTGLAGFDYLIGDREVAAPEEAAHYSETILRVPGSYLTFSVDYPVPPVADLPWRNKSAITFGCLCSQYKITEAVVHAWCRILGASPGSTLLLRNSHMGSSAAAAWQRMRFARHGIAADRLLFEGPTEHFEFLKTYDRIDVALDVFPYNGGTTTTEAIWQGVPVLTFSGDRWASRTSASILRAAGLGEFVADDLEGFVGKAIQLASAAESVDFLANLRHGMRRQLSAASVCDTRGFAREMERIYWDCFNKSAARRADASSSAYGATAIGPDVRG